MPKLLYLDSSDFSDLSAPVLSDSNRSVLDALRKYQSDGKAQFFFSLIHLSEAVHSASTHKQEATRRANLIAELCGSNALRFPNEIFGLELKKAFAGEAVTRLSLSEIRSPPSEWFGFRLDPEMKNWRAKIDTEFQRQITHLPRAERRKLKSEMSFSRTTGRARWRELCKSVTSSASNEFPFNVLDRDFVVQWMLREKSDHELLERLTKTLSDPVSMIHYVLDATGEREAIYRILRQQGQEIQCSMEKHLRALVDGLVEAIGPVATTLPIERVFRNSVQPALIYRGIIEGYSGRNVSQLSDKEIVALVRRCPAVSTFARLYLNFAYSLFEANWQRRKQGKSLITCGNASDFGDLMHAAYAPYMDFFRCDSHFGALLMQDATVRLRIVPKRLALVSVLQTDTDGMKVAS